MECPKPFHPRELAPPAAPARAASIIARAALLFLVYLLLSVSARAESPETLAFRTAAELFQDQHYALAESHFNDFVATYTNSTHRAEAILYLARSRLEQSNNAGAIDLLEQSFTNATGMLKWDYVFWIAKAREKSGDYDRAAQGFDNIARDSASGKVLEASYEEAACYSKLGNWPQVIRLLQQTNGAFHVSAAADPKNRFATMGTLLLGEAFYIEHQDAAGEKVVSNLDPGGLDSDSRWQRQYLLCELKMAAGRPEEALRESTNLLAVALGPEHQNQSVYLQGEILEQLGRPTDALQVYAKNLADGVPAEAQRQALIKTVELIIALNPVAGAAQALENLAAQRPQGPGLDLIRLNLGQLYLVLDFAPPAPATGTNGVALAQTNYLDAALTNLNFAVQNAAAGDLAAKAHLERGWCYWLRTNIGAARSDFAAAAAQLPVSEDQAVARLKVADADFYLGNYAGAVSNYDLLLRQYDKIPAVTNGLFDEALYQIVAADIQLGDVAGATAAAQKILTWYPGSYFGDRSLLARGEDFDRKYNYSEARRIFSDLLKRTPNSPLAPEVEYAIARTYAHEGNWPAAIHAYAQWETNHPRDSRLPEVEFSLAQAYDKAGEQTNAFMRFTNFASRFPGNSLVPWARNWVADFYWNQEDYPNADKQFQELSKLPDSADHLGYQAQLWAGRSALNHYALDDARQDFTDLIDNTNIPAPLAAQASFALADTILQQFQSNPTNTTYLSEAIAVMSKLTNGAPTNAIALEALGRLGDYDMYWADTKPAPEFYRQAAQMYSNILSFPSSALSPSVRCQAEVGLGLVAEKQHQLDLAFSNYCNVVYGFDSANFDPYWVARAGEFAARVCEEQQQWQRAVNIYKRVREAAPALGPILEQKIAAAQGHAEAARR